MEAEITVMDEGEMLACSLVGKYPFEDIRDVIVETCEHQAEITWQKAEEHYGKQNAIAFSSGVETGRMEGKRVGIREVVEWIESHNKSTCMDCLCAYDFREDEWQAKLKEWGIDGS